MNICSIVFGLGLKDTLDTVPAQVVSLDESVYVPLRQDLGLKCAAVGEQRKRKWFFNGREEASWISSTEDEEGLLRLPGVTRENDGNYTCYVENQFGSDSVNYQVNVQGKKREICVEVL